MDGLNLKAYAQAVKAEYVASNQEKLAIEEKKAREERGGAKPSGRPARGKQYTVEEVRTLLEAAITPAILIKGIRAIANLIHSTKTSPQQKIAALTLLLDRRFGKLEKQTMVRQQSITAQIDLSAIPTAELQQLETMYQNAIELKKE